MTPSFTLLLDWVEGRLDPDRAADVARAAESDGRVQETVAWIREFLDLAERDRLTEPPDDLKRSLRSLFSSVRGADQPSIEGSLALDSRTVRLAGVRGPGSTSGAVEHLVLEGEGLRITITLLDGPNGVTDLRGVVETMTGERVDEPAEIVLAATGRAARVVRTSPDGTFALGAVEHDVDALWYLGETRRFRCALSLRAP